MFFAIPFCLLCIVFPNLVWLVLGVIGMMYAYSFFKEMK